MKTAGIPARFPRALGRLVRALDLTDSSEALTALMPYRYENRGVGGGWGHLKPEGRFLIEGKVLSCESARSASGIPIVRALVRDGEGQIGSAIWFRAPFMEKLLKGLPQIALCGRAERMRGRGWVLTHPDYEFLDRADGRRIHTGRIVPFYPATEGLSQREARTALYEALLSELPRTQEFLSADTLRRRKLSSWRYAIRMIHFPKSMTDFESAYRRLVFEEFLCVRLYSRLGRVRALPAHSAVMREFEESLADDFCAQLPFLPTQDQIRAMKDLLKDWKKSGRVARLIQGDVGSGKTVIAAFAIWVHALRGGQSAVLVPTEILAQQHAVNLARLLSGFGIIPVRITAGVGSQERKAALEGLSRGEAPLVIGTHSLFEPEVRFNRLTLVVCDEHHKFGVEQRSRLLAKGSDPDRLLLTATPLPRTVALTLYGDLDLSVIASGPFETSKKRHTLILDSQDRAKADQLILTELKKKNLVFVVYPSIENLNGKHGVKQGFERVCRVFPNHRVFLAHGRLPAEENARVFDAFRRGESQILVTTTLIEVGVDVADATFLLVEQAERFGLSQLHQLRGRVGRRGGESYCVLLSESTEPAARERLEFFASSDSGFDIAEEDFKMRGPGDWFGTGRRQHGMPPIRFGDLVKDGQWMTEADEEAALILAEDPELRAPRHQGLRGALRNRFSAASLEFEKKRD